MLYCVRANKRYLYDESIKKMYIFNEFGELLTNNAKLDVSLKWKSVRVLSILQRYLDPQKGSELYNGVDKVYSTNSVFQVAKATFRKGNTFGMPLKIIFNYKGYDITQMLFVYNIDYPYLSKDNLVSLSKLW